MFFSSQCKIVDTAWAPLMMIETMDRLRNEQDSVPTIKIIAPAMQRRHIIPNNQTHPLSNAASPRSQCPNKTDTMIESDAPMMQETIATKNGVLQG